jgi:hypothetical protein
METVPISESLETMDEVRKNIDVKELPGTKFVPF